MADGAAWFVAGPAGPVRVHTWDTPGAAEAPGAPLLLALHGWTDAGDVFGPLVDRLSTPCSVVAPDAPGHGGTPLQEGDVYSVADHAVDALAVLDAVTSGPRPRPVIVLGHSLGALTAARVAAARPDVVGALVLEDPARTSGHRPGAPHAMRQWIEGLRSGGDEGLAGWVATEHPTWPAEEAGPWAASKQSVDLAHLDRRMEWGEPLVALLADVPQPVTLIVGEPDRGGIVSPAAARRCASVCRGGARLTVLPAGHCPRREAPERFADLLDEVLSATEPPPPRRRRSR